MWAISTSCAAAHAPTANQCGEQVWAVVPTGDRNPHLGVVTRARVAAEDQELGAALAAGDMAVEVLPGEVPYGGQVPRAARAGVGRPTTLSKWLIPEVVRHSCGDMPFADSRTLRGQPGHELHGLLGDGEHGGVGDRIGHSRTSGGEDISEKTSLLPRSCAVPPHLAAVGVSPLTCDSTATGKASVVALADRSRDGVRHSSSRPDGQQDVAEGRRPPMTTSFSFLARMRQPPRTPVSAPAGAEGPTIHVTALTARCRTRWPPSGRREMERSRRCGDTAIATRTGSNRGRDARRRGAGCRVARTRGRDVRRHARAPGWEIVVLHRAHQDGAVPR